MSGQKINFCSKFAIKPFRASVANAETGSQKILHSLFDTYLDHMLAIFKPNRIVRNVQNVEFFDKNKKRNKQTNKNRVIFKIIFDIALTPFLKDVAEAGTSENYSFSDYFLSVFQKSQSEATCETMLNEMFHQTWQTQPA